MDGAGEQMMPCRQDCDEPEGGAGGQEHTHELGARDEGGCVVLPAPTTSEEQKKT